MTFDADKMRLAESFDDIHGYHSDIVFDYLTHSDLAKESYADAHTGVILDEALEYLGGNALWDNNVTVSIDSTGDGFATFTLQAPTDGTL